MSLRRAATKGVKWTGASGVAVSALQSLRLVIVARLLSPEDFGLMAMIMVPMGFAGTFADTGFSDAIIYRQETTKEQVSSLYWTTWLTGLIIFGVLIAATPLAAQFYREPRINSLLPWTAVYFLIGPVGQQFKSLLQRDLRFREIAAIEIAAAVAGTIATIGLALLGYGIYALIFGQLLSGAVDSVLLAVVGWKKWAPSLHYRLRDLKEYASFGAYQIGERCANMFSSNVDYLLIGRVLGPVVLGPYTLAYQLIVAPVLRINPILTRVAFPIFAKRQNDPAVLRTGYLEISKFLALVSCPILVGVAAGAPVFVPVLLGDRWSAAIQLVEILAPVGILKTFANPSGSILLAKGRANLSFWLNVYVAVEYLIVFSIFVKSGTTAIAVAYLIMGFINFILGQVLINYLLGLTWRTYLGAIASCTVSALVMGIIVRFSWYVIEPKIGVSLLSAALLVFIGAVVYSLCILVSEQSYVRNMINLVRFEQQSR
ncbi:MOP flippase family protein [Bradyrhizobium canariense]|uniref:Polysaccharide transporter, PST family/teichuronic acid exporter n=1 Tax=Bradyrhizobium canariense TaxID=255045 RepID=A0A1H2BPC9_9BRAD|nr:MOP flippase family protein [Bradyrhizobium canariense]SDT59616.1 polysaccharide transporter, PST family/teichuronic acid exporter [Bradyrhizobium canariense]